MARLGREWNEGGEWEPESEVRRGRLRAQGKCACYEYACEQVTRVNFNHTVQDHGTLQTQDNGARDVRGA